MIEPLTYKETAVFKPELSSEDKAILYGITGGVPHYINKLADEKGVKLITADDMYK